MIFWRDTFIRLRAPLGPDEYGTPDALRDWSKAKTAVITGCLVVPAGSSESANENREAITDQLKVFAPAGTDLLGSDRISYEGVFYEMVGDGQSYQSPTGAVSHVEGLVRKVVG